jgi:hypothetical protein
MGGSVAGDFPKQRVVARCTGISIGQRSCNPVADGEPCRVAAAPTFAV